MSEEFEQAHEHLEHAADGHSSKGHTRPAIIIAIMAAALALTEFAAKDAQTNYLTNHIAASDTWAQYQAKAVRRTVLISEAELLQSLTAANEPQVQKRIADAQANAAACVLSPAPTAWTSSPKGRMSKSICAIMQCTVLTSWKSPAADCRFPSSWLPSQWSSSCRYS